MKTNTYTVSSICFALLLSAASLTAAPIVLDFEEFPTTAASPGSAIPLANRLSTQYLTTYGVTFSSAAPYVGVVTLGAGGTTSGVMALSGATPDGTVTYADVMFIAEFFDPTNTTIPAVTDFFSVRGDTVPDGTGGTLRAYDVNDQLIGEQYIANVSGDTFSFSVPGIHRVTFTGSGTIGLDDVTFDPVTSGPTATNRPQLTIRFTGLQLVGTVGTSNRIEYVSNLTDTVWTPLTNVFLTQSNYFLIDPDFPKSPRRFYRAVQLP